MARRRSGIGVTDYRRRVSGVSGSPPPPTPPVGGYVGWWDAFRITGQSDNTPLASWPDLSGNGFNYTQATGAARPTYYSTTAAKLVNGLPAVWFDGTDDFMGNTGPTYGAAQTFFLVGSGATGANEYLTSTSDADGAGPALIFGFTASTLEYFNVTLGGSGTDRFTFGAVGSATFAACWSQTDTVNLSGYLNSGSPVSSTTPHNGNATITNEYLGSAHGTANFYNGAVCEMLIYATQLSTANVDSTLTYLTGKWG